MVNQEKQFPGFDRLVVPVICILAMSHVGVDPHTTLEQILLFFVSVGMFVLSEGPAT